MPSRGMSLTCLSISSLRFASDRRDRFTADVEDPERDHLVLVLDVPGVVDDRPLGQILELLVARAPTPGSAEILPVPRLQVPPAEEDQHCNSSPRLVSRGDYVTAKGMMRGRAASEVRRDPTYATSRSFCASASDCSFLRL